MLAERKDIKRKKRERHRRHGEREGERMYLDQQMLGCVRND